MGTEFACLQPSREKRKEMSMGVTGTYKEAERSDVTALGGWGRTEWSPHQC